MGKIADAHPRVPRGLGKIATYLPGHGFFEAPPELVDRAIAEYLPASANELRALVEERAGFPVPELTSVSDALLVLASFYHDNPY